MFKLKGPHLDLNAVHLLCAPLKRLPSGDDMSAFSKSKLKAAKDAIGKQNYEKAQEAALGVLEYEPDNYHA